MCSGACLPPPGPDSFRLLGASGIATSSKKLLGAPGLTTRSKDATRGASTSNFLLLVARMLLVAMPGAPSSVLAPSSTARSP